MGIITENYGLVKPEGKDYYNIDDFNKNSDIIDNQIKILESNLCNENILINSNFKLNALVNQREENEYVTNGQKNVFDMWAMISDGNTKCRLLDDFIRLECVSFNTFYGISQKIENFKEYQGKTVTVSFKAKGVTGAQVLNVILRKNTGGTNNDIVKTFTLDTKMKLYTFTTTLFNYIDQSLSVLIYGTNNKGFDIEYIKVELGELATKLVDDDPATKLLKCQRYLQKIPYLFHAPLVFVNTTHVYFNVPLVTNMRQMPIFASDRIEIVNFTISNNNFHTVTGFNIYINNFKGANLVIRAEKNNHGLTTAFIKLYSDILISAEM